jgi:hypothetical protein
MKTIAQCIIAALVVVALSIDSCEAKAAEPVDLGYHEWAATPAYIKAGMVGRWHNVLDLDSSYRVEDLAYYWTTSTRVSGRGRVHKMKTQIVADCEQHAYAIKYVKSFDKDDKLLAEGAAEPSWVPVSPNTRASLEFSNVCK